jgi:autotransporter-associated beta strand protein
VPFTITDQNGSAGTTGAGGSGSVVIGDLTGDTGTVILSGDNTYTGNTTVESGTLSISADNDLGADKGALILQSGSTLQATANFTLQHAVEVSGDPHLRCFCRHHAHGFDCDH